MPPSSLSRAAVSSVMRCSMAPRSYRPGVRLLRRAAVCREGCREGCRGGWRGRGPGRGRRCGCVHRGCRVGRRPGRHRCGRCPGRGWGVRRWRTRAGAVRRRQRGRWVRWGREGGGGFVGWGEFAGEAVAEEGRGAVDAFRQAVEEGVGEVAGAVAAFQPAGDQGCECGGLGRAEAQARFRCRQAVQQCRRLARGGVRRPGGGGRDGWGLPPCLAPPARSGLGCRPLRGEGGSFPPVLYGVGATAAVGQWTGARERGTRRHLRSAVRNAVRNAVRDVVHVGFADEGAVRAAYPLDAVVAEGDQLAQSLAHQLAALDAAVGHVAAVLAPVVGPGEEVGQQAARDVGHTSVLQHDVGQDGETARMAATMDLHRELLLLVPDPGALLRCRGHSIEFAGDRTYHAIRPRSTAPGRFGPLLAWRNVPPARGRSGSVVPGPWP